MRIDLLSTREMQYALEDALPNPMDYNKFDEIISERTHRNVHDFDASTFVSPWPLIQVLGTIK